MELTQEILIEDGVISLDTAILAKTKGFSKGSKTVYIDYLDGSKTEYYRDYYTINNYKGVDLSNKSWTVYEAAQLHILQKWFREEHRINVNANWLPNLQVYRGLFTPMDIKPKELTKEQILGISLKYVSSINFDTYEEALEEALNKALELI